MNGVNEVKRINVNGHPSDNDEHLGDERLSMVAATWFDETWKKSDNIIDWKCDGVSKHCNGKQQRQLRGYATNEGEAKTTTVTKVLESMRGRRCEAER